MDSPSDLHLNELEPVRGYPRASVERLIIACYEERDRLSAGLAAARERLADAQARLAEASALRERLGSMVLETQQVLERERQENERSVAAILSSADADASQVVRTAQSEASRLRAAAGGTPRLVPTPTIDLSDAPDDTADAEPPAMAGR